MIPISCFPFCVSMGPVSPGPFLLLVTLFLSLASAVCSALPPVLPQQRGPTPLWISTTSLPPRRGSASGAATPCVRSPLAAAPSSSSLTSELQGCVPSQAPRQLSWIASVWNKLFSTLETVCVMLVCLCSLWFIFLSFYSSVGFSKPCPPKYTVSVAFQAMMDHLSRDHRSSRWPHFSSALIFADRDGMKEGFCGGV